MSYADIAVYLGPECDGTDSARYALALADALDVHLSGVILAIEPSVIAYAGAPYVPVLSTGFNAEHWTAQNEAILKAAHEVAERFDAMTRHRFAQTERRMLSSSQSSASEALTLIARYSDLLIAPLPADEPIAYRRRLETVLLGSGRPVLIVPDGVTATTPPRSVVIGWDGSREATRSIIDAMPLLRAAEHVTLVVINGDDEPEVNPALPGADIAAHLARHRIKVTVEHHDAGNLSVGKALLGVVKSHAADLLVVGGYGHARLTEYVLGGVTHEALRAATVPVLMAH